MSDVCEWIWGDPNTTKCGQSHLWLAYAGLHNKSDFERKIRFCWYCGKAVKIVWKFTKDKK
jgi:hypothetical protein